MTTEPETNMTPKVETKPVTAKQRAKSIVRTIVTWIVLATLWVADGLIWIMLRTRSDERLVRPTMRIPWPQGLKRELMRRQDYTCAYCGHRRYPHQFEIDHIFPVVRGGSNDIENLQVICRPCNMRKGIQSDEEFRDRYASLVPSKPLTPPRRAISQREFSTATQRTSQSDTVRKFRKSRFYTKSGKVSSGCTFLGFATVFIMLILSALLGIEGILLLMLPIAFGVALGFGVWLRAYKTGVMIED